MKPKNYIPLLNLLILCHFNANLSGQSWSWTKTAGSPAFESGKSIATDDTGALFFSGIFDGSLSIDGTEITTIGKDDIFLGKYDSEGNLAWLINDGGLFDDAINKITVDAQGNLICGGTYWNQATFGDQTLQSQLNPKALFLLQYTTEGVLNWARSFEGTGLKSLEDIDTDEAGNLYLCGYFEDSLHIQNTTLIANHFNSQLFIAKLNNAGQLQWAKQAGHLGDTRANVLKVNSQQEIFLTGTFNDTTYIGNDTLYANTFDLDIFIAKFDSTGTALWAKKAGGVHEEESTGLAFDSDGNIYVSGSMVGVMKLSDNISIQTPNGNPECFLLKYSPLGLPLIARAFGGDEIQQSADLLIQDDKIFLCGFYQNNMSVLDVFIEDSEGYGGFILEFDSLLAPQWATSILSSFGVFPEEMASNNTGGIFITGAFNQNILFGNSEFPSNGGYDGFFALLDTSPNAIPNTNTPSNISLYPNPVSDWLYIDTPLKHYQLFLFDIEGRLHFSGKDIQKINTTNLMPGSYFLLIQKKEQKWVKQFVKN